MAEVQNFSIEKATKETLRSLAMGWNVEKTMLKPASVGLKEILRFYLALETPKVKRKLEHGFNRAGIIFNSSVST